MKTFYGGTYIGKEILEENDIYHPIRLEYYKIETEKENELFYGIEVIKTEYKKEKTDVESNVVENVTMEETEIVEILDKFKEGTVMPSLLEEMVEEELKNEKSYA